MSITGFGVPATARTGATAPVGRLSPQPAAPANDFDSLTGPDRELIYQATGQRIEPGFDSSKSSTTIFAALIAAARSHGQLAPGQEVSAGYLTNLSRQYDQTDPANNPIAPFLDKALAYLNTRGGPRLDVTA